MTTRDHRHDYFFKFNYNLYLELLNMYEAEGFSLVENGDAEELVIFDPTRALTKSWRDLVKKSLLINDVGTIDWEELKGLRIQTRRAIIDRLFIDNKKYYDAVKKFTKSRYFKLAGNHDGYYSEEMEGVIEAQYWPGVIKDALRVSRTGASGSTVEFVITHGHQFDEACVPPHAAKIGEVFSECLSWAFQGPDRIWETSDTFKWTSQPKKEFSNVLSAHNAVTSTSKDLEAVLESLMGPDVAWEYFESSDPYMAFIKEVSTGEEFFKFRHMNEENLANALLRKWKSPLIELPVLICGHTHEPRHLSTFKNTTVLTPPQTTNKNLFTRYMNSGSAGRFQNLIWCIEIVGNTATVYSWTNTGTSTVMKPKKTKWVSNNAGKLTGTDV
jgi:hypothetical protein